MTRQLRDITFSIVGSSQSLDPTYITFASHYQYLIVSNLKCGIIPELTH